MNLRAKEWNEKKNNHITTFHSANDSEWRQMAVMRFINYAKPFTRIDVCGISHRHFSVAPNGLYLCTSLLVHFFLFHLFQHSDFACCIIDKLLKSKLYFDVDTVHHYCRWLWRRWGEKKNENTIKTNTAERRRRPWSCEKSKNFTLN